MSNTIRVVQYGLGPIGLECVRTVLRKQETGLVELVGAIDIDPEKVGKDVAELIGRPELTGILVRDDSAVALSEIKPDVVIHTTASFLELVHKQLFECVRAGARVISSTEELSFPYDRHPELSSDLDGLAREHGVAVVGTGVNPGYAMDTLALMATGVCADVTGVHVSRVVDAGKRRLPLLRKVGAGLTTHEFEEKKKTGKFGHIGLMESMLFVAKGLGWRLDRVEETLEPVVADRDQETPHLTVAAGQVAGIHHGVRGLIDSHPVLTLDLRMYVGAAEPHDSVKVVGTPPIDLVVREGIFGDTATVAALVNLLPIVLKAQPGLRTMMDLPIPRAFATSLLARKAAQAA